MVQLGWSRLMECWNWGAAARVEYKCGKDSKMRKGARKRSRPHSWSGEVISFDSHTKSAGRHKGGLFVRSDAETQPPNKGSSKLAQITKSDCRPILYPYRDFGFPSQIQYTAASKDNLQNYSLVTDTPVYVTALQSGINASEVCLACLLFQNEPSFVFTSFNSGKE